MDTPVPDLTAEQWGHLEALLVVIHERRRGERRTSIDQPPPSTLPAGVRPTWELVIEHLQQSGAQMPHEAVHEAITIAKERHEVGIARYGTPLHPWNGRNHLLDAIAEAADMVVYLRNELERLKNIVDSPTSMAVRYAQGVSLAYQAGLQQFVGLVALHQLIAQRVST